ncbi:MULTISPECIES: DUF3012 domain-containing protein [unclassified Methylophaga]|jgi:hypothetical protein|uniref:DUF3012 domain-containing protein n=1 Tax=unclassified Methylophaga TaxID=2629249 RepID=UPI000C8AFF00|nr:MULTISPECIES: DUF3012 domain-containing protein [unclassified Methylophaga]MAK68105.1 hypothetical protein [Methylophaga sp.]MAY17874.1 hypothetical protein [Methylophaga sp.]MBN46919.1 hypothetical protein [Methylophaga sp.]HAO26021.1 DUF3012 domain-containing protein [Methylophaga sp.]HCD03952.1 DUF3012 domain-containing protein [Methylophaga sp.]|tara:strand:+ start:15015 stop:15191 length:177 start_codon:yes stop_codon:yes gene_type:complete
MTIMRYCFRVLGLLAFTVLFSACTPEIGSDEWCVHMKEKPKGDWTANEAGAYAEHCLL